MKVSSKGQSVMIPIIIIGVVGLLVLIITFASSHFLMREVNSVVQTDDSFNNQSQEMMNDITNRNNVSLDNAFIFLVGGLIIACFVAGFNINRTPLFLILVIILMFFVAYAGMKITNFYEDFAADDTDLEFSTYFPKANFVMSNLGLFVLGMIFSFGLGAIMRGNTSL